MNEENTNNNEEKMNVNIPQENMRPDETSPNPMGDGKEDKSFGPLIGIVIIVIILILGGLYFWGQQVGEESLEELAPSADEVIGTLEMQGSSDELIDIEDDLNITDLDNLDADLDAIESELGL